MSEMIDVAVVPTVLEFGVLNSILVTFIRRVFINSKPG